MLITEAIVPVRLQVLRKNTCIAISCGLILAFSFDLWQNFVKIKTLSKICTFAGTIRYELFITNHHYCHCRRHHWSLILSTLTRNMYIPKRGHEEWHWNLIFLSRKISLILGLLKLLSNYLFMAEMSHCNYWFKKRVLLCHTSSVGEMVHVTYLMQLFHHRRRYHHHRHLIQSEVGWFSYFILRITPLLSL